LDGYPLRAHQGKQKQPTTRTRTAMKRRNLYLNHSENRARYRTSCSSSNRTSEIVALIRGEPQWRELISHSVSSFCLRRESRTSTSTIGGLGIADGRVNQLGLGERLNIPLVGFCSALCIPNRPRRRLLIKDRSGLRGRSGGGFVCAMYHRETAGRRTTTMIGRQQELHLNSVLLDCRNFLLGILFVPTELGSLTDKRSW
jgi:hypothetical protein